MPLAAGQVLESRYRIVKLLGQGGFGAVYRGWDLRLDIPVAVKENLDASDEAQRQFGREAKMLAGLSHPSLPKVSDYFFVPGQGQYLVMEYVAGQNLEQMVEQRGALSEAQALPWIGQVSEALTYLHNQQPPIIHRDIKPANIIISKGGRAMLVDFGIAKVYNPKLMTTVGAKAATPGFAPIEQYVSSSRTDSRTDVYGLGATMYFIFTGKIPAEAPERNMGIKLAAPRTLNPRLSVHVEEGILKSLETLPEERLQSVEALKSTVSQPLREKQVQPLNQRVVQPLAMAGAPPVVSKAPAGKGRSSRKAKDLLPASLKGALFGGLAGMLVAGIGGAILEGVDSYFFVDWIGPGFVVGLLAGFVGGFVGWLLKGDSRKYGAALAALVLIVLMLVNYW